MMATGERDDEPRKHRVTLGPDPKTMRHFYCRDSIWASCERLASEFECSIDYIINESMRFYARSKHYERPLSADSACVGTPTPPPVDPEVEVFPPGTLFLEFEGRRHAITKDAFIIGRGAKDSDLPIKDSNISRKHAIVIRRHGTYYIKDLGSTNGLGYQGMRIENRRIDEGDIFYICDHELRFTYR
jgi:hypothetical protein